MINRAPLTKKEKGNATKTPFNTVRINSLENVLKANSEIRNCSHIKRLAIIIDNVRRNESAYHIMHVGLQKDSPHPVQKLMVVQPYTHNISEIILLD